MRKWEIRYDIYEAPADEVLKALKSSIIIIMIEKD